jgi:hypothetical protein
VNWLGAGLRGLSGSIVGCFCGALLFLFVLRRGVELPPLVGLAAGIGAMLASREKSGTRGLVVGAMAVWACAIAKVSAAPVHGLLIDMANFSDRLGWLQRFSYALCALFGILLGGRAIPHRSPDSEHSVVAHSSD